MAVGSVAGMAEHMAMFPVDTLKTRMKVAASTGGSLHIVVGKTFISMTKSEGPLGFYMGIAAMGFGVKHAHVVYFSVYEVCKEMHSCGWNI
jgi:solute carrier family 25 iron transporter 28/37